MNILIDQFGNQLYERSEEPLEMINQFCEDTKQQAKMENNNSILEPKHFNEWFADYESWKVNAVSLQGEGFSINRAN